MKKKLLILGLAGAMLFSGISVSAAANQCGHPAVTLYFGGTEETSKCDEHVNCTKVVTWGLQYATCHNCFVTFFAGRVPMGESHSVKKN